MASLLMKPLSNDSRPRFSPEYELRLAVAEGTQLHHIEDTCWAELPRIPRGCPRCELFQQKVSAADVMFSVVDKSTNKDIVQELLTQSLRLYCNQGLSTSAGYRSAVSSCS
jgi:hypothetical protein